MKGFIKIAGLFYFALLIYIFFLAKRRPRPSFHWGHHSVNYIPFHQKIQHFTSSYTQPRAYQWIFYTDIIGNIAIFVPFVLILFFAFNIRSKFKVFIISVLTSITVECTQFFLDIGVADIDDVILNTLGALLGIIAIRILQKSAWIPFEKMGIQRY